MSAKVLSHPAAKFHEMLRQAKDGGVGDAIALFKFALEKGISRSPLLKLLEELSTKQKRLLDEEEIKQFVRWCGSKKFIVAGRTGEEHSSTPEAEAPERDGRDDNLSEISNKKRQELLQKAAEIGTAVGEAHAELKAHKYWYFRPGHEVNTAFWSNAFKDDDPVLTIVWYLRTFFKQATTNVKSQLFNITSDDISIFQWIIDRAANRLASRSQNAPVNLRGCLITASGLEDVLDGGIGWTDEIFLADIILTSKWERGSLIQYWGSRAEFDSLETNNEAKQTARVQAGYIGRCLSTYFGLAMEPKLKQRFEVDFLSDSTICHCIDKIQTIYYTCGDDELEAELRQLQAELYKSREAVFGGVFPFRFEDGHMFLDLLPSKDEFWLSTIIHYVPEHYSFEIDEFSLFNALRTDQEQSEDIRANRSAGWRYRAYRNVYEICEKEGLRELATAWWAFFVATQAIGFRGFGLTAAEAGDVCAICAGMMTSPTMSKAVRFALDWEKERSTNLASRVCIARLAALLDDSDDDSTAEVASIVTSKRRAESFLRDKLGPTTWDALHDLTRGDLLEAEQRLSLAFRELAAGRHDWGSLYMDFARAIEREVRLHIDPLVTRLIEAGVLREVEGSAGQAREKKELGYYIARVREAKNIFRSGGPPASDTDADHIRRLNKFFSENGFIADYRNIAAHGDEQAPITDEQYLRCRKAILVDDLFATVVTVS